MATDVFTGLIIIGLGTWFVHVLWVYTLKPVAFRARYHELYKLHLLEEDLKERKLSFEFLDELYKRICQDVTKRQTLDSIDQEHKEAKEEIKKNESKK